MSLQVNPASAAAARKVLKQFTGQHQECTVVGGGSHERKVVTAVRKAVARAEAEVVCVLHEIFGFFASSEGAPLALRQLRTDLLRRRKGWGARKGGPGKGGPGKGGTGGGPGGPGSSNGGRVKGVKGRSTLVRFMPGRAATFFVPTAVTVRDMAHNDDVYVTHKLSLVHRLDFTEVALSDCRYFEDYDFGADEVPLVQTYEHDFVVARDGELNSLSCFLFVDFGTPARRGPRCDGYPFGDPRLATAGPSNTDNQLTHHYIPPRVYPSTAIARIPRVAPHNTSGDDAPLTMSLSSNGSYSSYASNWRNPVIALPRTVDVRKGDRVLVTSHTDVTSQHPSYSFAVRVLRAADAGIDADGEICTGEVLDDPRDGPRIEDLGRVDLAFEDLYPTFTLYDKVALPEDQDKDGGTYGHDDAKPSEGITSDSTIAIPVTATPTMTVTSPPVIAAPASPPVIAVPASMPTTSTSAPSCAPTAA